MPDPSCGHGVTFDEAAAREILDGWEPKDDVERIMGNPAAAEVRRRWPRPDGPCPLGCGYVGIAYASPERYRLGDW